jgi:hypothetical protein
MSTGLERLGAIILTSSDGDGGRIDMVCKYFSLCGSAYLQFPIGLQPLTQLRVRLGFASPTLLNPLPPGGEEG